VVCSFAFACFFFFFAYYSKEYILLSNLFGEFELFKSILFLSSFLTVLYTVRLFIFLHGLNNLVQIPKILFTEQRVIYVDFFHACALTLLGIFSIVSGYIFFDSFLNYDLSFKLNNIYFNIEYELYSYSILVLIMAFCAYILILYAYLQNKTMRLFYFMSYWFNCVSYVITNEFLIPIIYWCIVRSFSSFTYNYIILCYERWALDSLTFLSLYLIFLEFFKKNKISMFYSIIFFLSEFVFSLIFIFILIYTEFNYIYIIILPVMYYDMVKPNLINKNQKIKFKENKK